MQTLTQTKSFTLHFHKTEHTVTVQHPTLAAAALQAVRLEAGNPEWGYVAAIVEN
jgi:hypothetical protein